MIDNNYPESVEESGRYLRIVLDSISKHGLPYNPITFSFWYEYASGRNERLIREIEPILKSPQNVTPELIYDFYRKYILDSNTLLAEKKIKEFQRIITETTKHIAKSSTKLGSQSHNLESYAVEIGESTAMNVISEIANKIVSETKSVIDSTKSIEKRVSSTVSEIDTLRKELEGMKQQANTDMLTKLLNRRGFNKAILEIMKMVKAKQIALSVVLIDIDNFKKINDKWGHLIGDHVLKMVGKLLSTFVKGKKDVAARFGGEEFIILLPGKPLDDAVTLAENIRTYLAKMKWKNRETGKTIGNITISLGVSQHKKGDTADSLIKRADDALYYAKENGRNRTITENERP